METLKDIQISQSTDVVNPVKAKEEAEFNRANMLAAHESKAAPESEYIIFKLVNTKRKGRIHIDGTDDVINPKTKVVERIRLLAGVPSIWVKEQKDITKEYVAMNRRSLTFENKVLKIPKWDTTAIDFARTCRHFVDSPTKRVGSKTPFFEWNAAKQAEFALKKRNEKFEAMRKAFETDVEIMRKHALYLGVIFTDEMGLPKGDDALRNDYVSKAETDPERFLKSFGSPLVELSFTIKKAIKEAKIDLGKTQGMAHWADGGLIAAIPAHKNNVDYLVELAMTNSEEGKRFKDTLAIIMSK